MKKMIALLAAVLSLAACKKEAETPVNDCFIFSSDQPVTRTEWDGTTVRWAAGDRISMAYTVDGLWQGPALYPSDPVKDAGRIAQFRVPASFPDGGTGAHSFYAVSPAAASTDFSDAPDYLMTLPTRQTPAADSYDPAADLMVARSDVFRSRPSGVVPLYWTRLVAHGDLTLTNLGLADDEKIESVLFTAQERAELTGDILVDLSNGETATAGVNTLYLDGRNLTPEQGRLHCWISILPLTLTELSVRVETDRATYEKSFSGLSKTFLPNARNILEISMKSASVTPKEQAGKNYVLVTSAPSDLTGDYLIVYSKGSLALKAGTPSDDRGTGSSVSISDGKIPYAGNEALNVRIERDGNAWTLRQGSVYLGMTASKNKLNFSESVTGDSFRWTLSVSGGNTSASPVAYSSMALQWNSSASMFRCYSAGSQTAVQFYRLDGAASGEGGDTPSVPTVTTGAAESLSTTEAKLTATYTGDAVYAGFEIGLSPTDLSDDWASQYVLGGSFSATVTGLAPGKTYYYRAYIAVLEGSEYKYYYGNVLSLTTPSDAVIVVGGDQPGWFETPRMSIARDGKYRVNADNPSEYYAFHMCTGGEKGPDGKTARNYTVCYSAEYHCPVWVAAPRHSMYVGGSGRNDSYRVDPDIPSSIQYSSKSTGGGCNKGHMLGSAERTSSVSTNRDVFYYTNIAPQLSSGFNTGGGGWNLLEDWVDTQVCADTLYEVVGCYFKQFTDGYGKSASPQVISFGSRDDVSMPTMFYYVLLRTKKGNSGKSVANCTSAELKCAAFVRAHSNANKGQDVTRSEMMSVADLEKLTGITYFPNIPHAPKSTLTPSDWGL